MSMDFKPWRDFVPHVQPSVPNCPVPTMVNAIREAAIEFCQATGIWPLISEKTTLLTGEEAYKLASPDNAEVEAVNIVRVNGRNLTPITEDDFYSKPKAAGPPKHYVVVEPLTVLLWPAPDTMDIGAMEVKASLQPSNASTESPAFLFTRHREAIVAGALSKLMIIPEKPWTNPQLSSFNEAKFKSKKNEARIIVEKGGTTASLRLKRRPFI